MYIQFFALVWYRGFRRRCRTITHNCLASFADAISTRLLDAPSFPPVKAYRRIPHAPRLLDAARGCTFFVGRRRLGFNKPIQFESGRRNAYKSRRCAIKPFLFPVRRSAFAVVDTSTRPAQHNDKRDD